MNCKSRKISALRYWYIRISLGVPQLGSGIQANYNILVLTWIERRDDESNEFLRFDLNVALPLLSIWTIKCNCCEAYPL